MSATKSTIRTPRVRIVCKPRADLNTTDRAVLRGMVASGKFYVTAGITGGK